MSIIFWYTVFHMKNKTLYRKEEGVMLGGVSGGLADYFNIDISWVRIAFVVLTLFASGLGLIMYIAMWIILPQESAVKKPQKQEKKPAQTKTIAAKAKK